MDALVIGDLVGLAAGDIAHLLEAEGDGIAVPHIHRVAHQRVQRLGHVEAAHAAAGDASGAGTRPRLVEDDHFGARALAAGGALHGQVPGGAEAVDAGADDDIGDGFGKGVVHGAVTVGHSYVLCSQP